MRDYFGQADMTQPELLSHIYPGQEIETIFPVIMCQYDVYQVNVKIIAGGRSMFLAGTKLKHRPDLPSVKDRLSLHRLSRDRATVDRATVDRATVDRTTVDRKTVDRVTVDRATVDRATVDRTTVDRATVDRATIDRATVDRTTVDRATVDRATVDRTTVDRATVDRTTVDRATVDRATVDRATVDRATVDRATVDRAREDKIAINSAALRKNTFPEVQQFPSRELPASPPAAASPGSFNLNTRREVTNVERSRRSATARTVDPGNESPRTSARNAEAAFADDLVQHDSGGIGDSDYVRLDYKTQKVDFRNECEATSGQLTEFPHVENCNGDNLREAEDSAYVGRDETTGKADVSAIKRTALSEWYSEAAFSEKYICGGRRDARKTEHSVGGTARTGFGGEQRSVLAKSQSAAATLSDLQVEAKETEESKRAGKNRNEVESRGPEKSKHKVEAGDFGAESREQGEQESASGNLDGVPTAEKCVLGNTGKDTEAAGAGAAITNVLEKSKKMGFSYSDKEAKKSTVSAEKCSPETETGNPVAKVVRPWDEASHEKADTKILYSAKVKIAPSADIRIVPSALDTRPIEPTYSGVILSVSKCSCVAAFRLNGSEEAARCCRAFATLDGRLVPQDVSLKVTLEVGARAVLSCVKPYSLEPNSVFGIRYQAVVSVEGAQKKKVTIVLTKKSDICLSDLVVPGVVIPADDRSADASKPIEPTYSGVILSLSERSCVAAFRLNGSEEAARCCRAFATLNGRLVLQDVSLKDTLEVGARAVLSRVKPYSVEPNSVFGIRYQAVVAVEGAQEKKVTIVPAATEKSDPCLSDLVIPGVVVSVGNCSATASCRLDGLDEKVVFTALYVFVVGTSAPQGVQLYDVVPWGTPFCDVITVGTKVTLTSFKPYSTRQDKTILYRASASVDQNDLLMAPLSAKASVLSSSVNSAAGPNPSSLNTTATPEPSSLNTTAKLKPSWLKPTSESKKAPLHAAAELKPPPPPSTVTEPKPSSFVTTLDDLYKHSFQAVIFSLKSKSGVATFKLDGRMQKARFTRANVNIDGVVVPQNVPLSETLSVGTKIVLRKVEEHNEHDLTVLYKGDVSVITRSVQLKSKVSLEAKPNLKTSSLGAVPKQTVAKLKPEELKPTSRRTLEESKNPVYNTGGKLFNRRIRASVFSLREKSGVATFTLDGQVQKARFTRADAFIEFNTVRVPQNVPLSETLGVGDEVFLLCVEEHNEHDPTVLYKGSICVYTRVGKLKTNVTQKTSVQSTAPPSASLTQLNITKLQPKDNLKSNTEVTKSLQDAKKKIPLVARSSKIFGTIKTHHKSCVQGLAYFMYQGHYVTTVFTINEFVIDNCHWNPLFAKDIIREGMIVKLTDFELSEEENYISYFTKASIVTKLSECQVVASRKPINYNPAMEKPSRTGVIVSTLETESGRACPRVVAVTIDRRTEHVFVGHDEVTINGLPEAEYKHALPSDYFRVGMTVGLTKLKPCERGSVGQSHAVASCTYEAGVAFVDGSACFVDMLRASRKAAKSTAKANVDVGGGEAATKAPTSAGMGSDSVDASCDNARTVEIESIAESRDRGSSRSPVPEVERETVSKTDAGRVKVAVRLIKMADRPQTAKCEMGTQTFVTGPVVTKQCLVDV